MPFLSPGDLPNPGIEPAAPAPPALAGGFFTTGPPGKSPGKPLSIQCTVILKKESHTHAHIPDTHQQVENCTDMDLKTRGEGDMHTEHKLQSDRQGTSQLLCMWKIAADSNFNQEIKRCSWKESYDKPRQVGFKKQRHHFADKGPYIQSDVFF